jgi:hypothetical protein
MLCPSNPTPINRQDIKSGTAVFLEGDMRAEAVVSTRFISPTLFRAGSADGKRWQIFSHSAIQPDPYLHSGSATSPQVFRERNQLHNPLNLNNFLRKCQNHITRNLRTSESIPCLCNLSLICVIKDFSISEKSCIFFLTSKSTPSIIHN